MPGGAQGPLIRHPESSWVLVLLLGCVGRRLRGGSWVRPERKMTWKACWAGPQGDGVWGCSCVGVGCLGWMPEAHSPGLRTLKSSPEN